MATLLAVGTPLNYHGDCLWRDRHQLPSIGFSFESSNTEPTPSCVAY